MPKGQNRLFNMLRKRKYNYVWRKIVVKDVELVVGL